MWAHGSTLNESSSVSTTTACTGKIGSEMHGEADGIQATLRSHAAQAAMRSATACHTGGAGETNRPPATEQLYATQRAVKSVSATRRIHSPPASRHTGQAGPDMCTSTISLRQAAGGIVHLPNKASTLALHLYVLTMPASSGIGRLLNAESTHTTCHDKAG
jgi:hypothetical protein